MLKLSTLLPAYCHNRANKTVLAVSLCLSGFWTRSSAIWILVFMSVGAFSSCWCGGWCVCEVSTAQRNFPILIVIKETIVCRQSVRGWKGTVKYGADSRSSSLTCFRFVKSPDRHALCHYSEIYYMSPKQTSTPCKNHLQHRALEGFRPARGQ